MDWREIFKVMRKYVEFLFVILLMFCSFGFVSGEFVIETDEYASVTEALAAIPMDSETVTLKLSKSNLKDNETSIDLPYDRNIKEIIIIHDDNISEASFPLVERICANGVPLTIGEGITLENTSIYGGRCVSGEDASLESASLTISGKVGFVFGGGLATDGGRSDVAETSVTLTKSGLVYYEIFGGGHAHGSGSSASAESTTLKISGTSDYVLGGGFAEEGGSAECGSTFITTEEGSSVPVALFTGGSASGTGSLSAVENAKALVAGNANWAFSGDFAFGGGKTMLNLASRLEILPSGSTEIAYMGSFASDEGSDALVNTAELMVCGEASRIVQDSQTADNGKALTQVKALFPCDQGERVP